MKYSLFFCTMKIGRIAYVKLCCHHYCYVCHYYCLRHYIEENRIFNPSIILKVGKNTVKIWINASISFQTDHEWKEYRIIQQVSLLKMMKSHNHMDKKQEVIGEELVRLVEMFLFDIAT